MLTNPREANGAKNRCSSTLFPMPREKIWVNYERMAQCDVWFLVDGWINCVMIRLGSKERREKMEKIIIDFFIPALCRIIYQYEDSNVLLYCNGGSPFWRDLNDVTIAPVGTHTIGYLGENLMQSSKFTLR
jgi:hypothetical protein